MLSTLHYIHDPMCSWCWGFRSAWHDLTSRLLETYPELIIRNVVGGLAPDSDEPMPMEMQQMLQSAWQRIQHTIPNTSFNYDFWRIGEPRRSTYPACRAVIASAQQGTDPIQSHVNENAMIDRDTDNILVSGHTINRILMNVGKKKKFLYDCS